MTKMSLKTIAKSIGLLVMVLAIAGCAGKTTKPKKVSKMDDREVGKQWQWDDQRKTWLSEGNAFEPIPTEPTVWESKDQAITLHIDAAKSFHTFDKSIDGLVLKVFQLSDSKAFLRSGKSTSGLRHLLTIEPIDPANLETKTLLIVPGKAQRATLNRQQGARYVGIVLGYANLKQDKIFRLIPIVAMDNDEKVEKSTAKATKDLVHPALLDIKLSLGEEGIRKLEVNVE